MNGAMWSLSVEFQFYAAFAIVAIAAVSLRISPRLIGSATVICAAVVYAVCTYSRICLALGVRADQELYLTRFKFDFMAAGVLLAYAPQAMIGRTFRYGRALSIALLLIPLIILSLCPSPLEASSSGPDYLEGVGMPLTCLCYVALVMLAVGGNVSRALPSSINRMLFVIGEELHHIPVTFSTNRCSLGYDCGRACRMDGKCLELRRRASGCHFIDTGAFHRSSVSSAGGAIHINRRSGCCSLASPPASRSRTAKYAGLQG